MTEPGRLIYAAAYATALRDSQPDAAAIAMDAVEHFRQDTAP